MSFQLVCFCGIDFQDAVAVFIMNDVVCVSGCSKCIGGDMDAEFSEISKMQNVIILVSPCPGVFAFIQQSFGSYLKITVRDKHSLY